MLVNIYRVTGNEVAIPPTHIPVDKIENTKIVSMDERFKVEIELTDGKKLTSNVFWNKDTAIQFQTLLQAIGDGKVQSNEARIFLMNNADYFGTYRRM